MGHRLRPFLGPRRESQLRAAPGRQRWPAHAATRTRHAAESSLRMPPRSRGIAPSCPQGAQLWSGRARRTARRRLAGDHERRRQPEGDGQLPAVPRTGADRPVAVVVIAAHQCTVRSRLRQDRRGFGRRHQTVTPGTSAVNAASLVGQDELVDGLRSRARRGTTRQRQQPPRPGHRQTNLVLGRSALMCPPQIAPEPDSVGPDGRGEGGGGRRGVERGVRRISVRLSTGFGEPPPQRAEVR